MKVIKKGILFTFSKGAYFYIIEVDIKKDLIDANDHLISRLPATHTLYWVKKTDILKFYTDIFVQC